MTSRSLMLLPLLLLSACAAEDDTTCDNAICPAIYYPPVSLTVTSPAGRALTDVTVTGAQSQCSRVGDTTILCTIGSGAGEYVLDIQAEGFHPVHLEATAAARPRTECDCCSPEYVPQTLGLRLEPAT
ncbi:hypothetical protein [Pyxidicoccus sp. MSG2]|uniref:hypothetical protein n=1 Tax=Pyxidicoccus sp. MSG2 TaxID=2996790 RepID=UPI00226DE413|nr:hypothetical protein [Pyxidicoccus sp. MSG2]MCY1023297.1 hypothetical protein [Pyxidicoccus sp. MSG2]